MRLRIRRQLSILAAISALAALVLMPSSGMAIHFNGCQDILPLPDPSNPAKYTLCHFTGSDSNPFVINEVSFSAVSAHTSHHGDCYRAFGGPDICF